MKRSMIGSTRLLAAALVVSFAGHVVLTADAQADTLAKITESKYILMGTWTKSLRDRLAEDIPARRVSGF